MVDHVQLMSSSGSEKGDYEKFTAISRASKQTAVEIDVPILELSQTSRAAHKEHRSELEISDMRGSGALEEDAAAVMLLFEDAEDSKLAKAELRYATGPVKSILKLGKNRFGEAGRLFELIATRLSLDSIPPKLYDLVHIALRGRQGNHGCRDAGRKEPETECDPDLVIDGILNKSH